MALQGKIKKKKKKRVLMDAGHTVYAMHVKENSVASVRKRTIFAIIIWKIKWAWYVLRIGDKTKMLNFIT
jgi:Holliday junction resolvasome RuvABC DNA-binding subunit